MAPWAEWVHWIAGVCFLCGNTLGLFFSLPLAWVATQHWSKEAPKDAMAIVFFILVGYGPLLGNLIGLWLGYHFVRLPGKRRRKAEQFAATGEASPAPSPVRPAGGATPPRRQGSTRWSACNVLLPGSQIRQLWQFNAGGLKFNLARSESKLPSEPLPEKLVAKDWQTVFQPRLNIAFGAPASISHTSTPPSSRFTSSVSQLCGLIHSIFLTTPCSLIGLAASNSEENA